MTLRTLAFANLRRRKGKAIFLALGMAIGIGTVVALLSLSGAIREEIGTQMDRFGANIVVLPQSNNLALDYGGLQVSSVSFDVRQLTDEDARHVRDIPYRDRLSLISPKLLSAVEVEGRQALLAGVDFDSELQLKRWWRMAGRAPAAEDELLVGHLAAESLALIEPGAAPAHDGAHHGGPYRPPFRIARDRLAIAGREHRVAGVLAETGGPEDRMIFAALPRVQGLVGKPGQLSLIEVSALCKDCPVEDIVAQIAERLPHAKVAAIQQAARARAETVERLTRFSAAVSLVVLAIGALMVFTTMTGSVIERTREIGVLRALGFRKAHIIKGLMIEVAVVSVAGGLAGWAAGALAGWAALPLFAETAARFALNPALAVAAVAAGLLVGMVSSLYPILRAARLDPGESVRHV